MKAEKRPGGSEVEGMHPFQRPDSWREERKLGYWGEGART